MQRVRKFLIVKVSAPIGSRLTNSALSDGIHCDGWHQSWSTAVRLKESNESEVIENGNHGELEVAIAEESSLLVIALFSQRNLESLAPIGRLTKWRTVKVAGGAGYWCSLNYSDYGWGWVSGAEREVPFRLQFFERRVQANPSGLLSRTRLWIREARDWIYGQDKKIG